jgi:hypothetical protein
MKPKLSRSRRCVQLACIVFGSLLLGACGTARAHTGSPSRSLLASVAGTGSRLRINEVSGRVGILALGQSVASVKHRLPSRYFWLTQTHGDDLTYCSTGQGTTCSGVIVNVFDRCAFRFCSGKQAEGIGRFDLVSTRAASPSAWRSVSTLRGIHLGSPARAVVTRYKVTERGPEVCGGGPPPGATYVTITGPNTTMFTIHNGTVWAISVSSGKDPHFCREHVIYPR